ncbi:MAG: acyl carrier protein [Solirubrobacteraceae bacterium]|jgi:acyl carrier protein|nr:acyl carrier protein [Solirubrobacteraceae bacterium]MDX6670483.1 acyl carrier protein [Solirubrobacteraceae bacterium]
MTEKEEDMDEGQVLELVRGKLDEIKVENAAGATMDTTWEELEVDSLDLVELVQALEDEYGVRIEDEQLKGVKTVGDAVRLVVAAKGEAGAAA